MNGAQDLGGMMGFGAILPEPDEPVFHHRWEKRALAITIAAGACGQWNLDMSRHARESLNPAEYLAKSYYDIWICGLEKLLLGAGMISEEELQAGRALAAAHVVSSKLRVSEVAGVLARGTPYDRPASTPPLYATGDKIRTRVMNPRTHTRLPRYARGKTGFVEAMRGCFVFPNSNAHGEGENPAWCYTVTFTGEELWGTGADPQVKISVDAWEPYLERA